ncbi:hypothetical protein [Homoserinimonas hongtaonis]|uniref:Uncharacterized protein n=1 Tax=Homoserinimonas hongtaonis TaxID=2079791 RepID=A0A2U1SXM1_9MICO|nr:hypothetical protein [Salinibacterium hongtaonis]PWB96338.1 hypothetical protein DF220_13430 [Salinibacterium hongtaonis]
MNDQSSSQGQTPSSPTAQGGELRRDRKSLREAARNEARRPVLGRRAAPEPELQPEFQSESQTPPESPSHDDRQTPPVSAAPLAQPTAARFPPAPPAVPSVPISSYLSATPAFAPTPAAAAETMADAARMRRAPDAATAHESSSVGSSAFEQLGIDISDETEESGSSQSGPSHFDSFATRSFTPPAVSPAAPFGGDPFSRDEVGHHSPGNNDGGAAAAPFGSAAFLAEPISAQSAVTHSFAPTSFAEPPTIRGEQSDQRFRSATGELPLALDPPVSQLFSSVSASAAAPAFASSYPAPAVPFPGGERESLSPATGAHPVLGALNPTVPDLSRDQVILDRAALAAAVVVPPAGFALALYALRRGRELRGWASNLARAAVAVSIVMTVVFAIGAGLLWANAQRQAAADQDAAAAAASHDAIVAEAAEFCATLAATPQVFASGDAEFGWPAYSGDEDAYFAEADAYGALWQQLVAVAPAAITEQVTSVSARVDGIVSVASSLPNVNRAGNVLDLTSQDDISTVGTFVGDYCN